MNGSVSDQNKGEIPYVVLAGVATLAGCQSSSLEDMSAFGDSAKTVEDDSAVAFYKNDELITTGKLQFQEKNYGKSYAIYKRAVTVFPQDPAAWLGFAASPIWSADLTPPIAPKAPARTDDRQHSRLLQQYRILSSLAR